MNKLISEYGSLEELLLTLKAMGIEAQMKDVNKNKVVLKVGNVKIASRIKTPNKQPVEMYLTTDGKLYSEEPPYTKFLRVKDIEQVSLSGECGLDRETLVEALATSIANKEAVVGLLSLADRHVRKSSLVLPLIESVALLSNNPVETSPPLTLADEVKYSYLTGKPSKSYKSNIIHDDNVALDYLVGEGVIEDILTNHQILSKEELYQKHYLSFEESLSNINNLNITHKKERAVVIEAFADVFNKSSIRLTKDDLTSLSWMLTLRSMWVDSHLVLDKKLLIKDPYKEDPVPLLAGLIK